MALEIVCTVNFSSQELNAIDCIAASLSKTRDELIREAVRYFSNKCVPTQRKTKSQLSAER